MIKELILTGKFEAAHKSLKALSNLEISNILKNIIWDNESITVYGFVCYLLSLNEQHEFQIRAAYILALHLNYIEGAYPLALYHARRALELDPENLDYLQFLIYFYNIPEKIIKEDEAYDIAQKILVRNPESGIAKKTINWIEKKK